MSIPIQIDEKRVIACHNAELPVTVIAKRFNCGIYRIKRILTNHGLDSRANYRNLVTEVPIGGRIVRRGHHMSLGD